MPVGGDIDRQAGADNVETRGVGKIVDRHADLGIGAGDAHAIERDRAHWLERRIDAAELDAVLGSCARVLHRDIGERDVAIVFEEGDRSLAGTAGFGGRVAGEDDGVDRDRIDAGGVADMQAIVLAAGHSAVGQADAVVVRSRVHQDDLVARTGEVDVVDAQRLACAAAIHRQGNAARAVNRDIADTLQRDPFGHGQVLGIDAFMHFHGVAGIGRRNARTNGRERAHQVVAGIKHQHIGGEVEIDAAAVEVDAFNAVQRICFAGAGIADLPGTVGIAGNRIVVLVAVDDDRVVLAGDRIDVVCNVRVRTVAVDGVVAAVDKECIVAGATDHGVTACAARDLVIAGATIQQVVAAIAGKHVIVAVAVELVVADATAQRVIAVIAVCDDAHIGSRNRAGHAGRVDNVVAGPALDLDGRNGNTGSCKITGDVERAAAGGEVDIDLLDVLHGNRIRTGRGREARGPRNSIQRDGLARRCR